MKTLLVTGGSGYIGSHMCYLLQQEGYRIVVVDNEHYPTANHLKGIEYIKAPLSEPGLLGSLFQRESFAGVFHFAAFIEAGWSVNDPITFYQNNVGGSICLLEALKTHPCPIIFSSSAAVYGNPFYSPMDEKHPITPISPYGKTKAMVEDILKDMFHAHQIPFGILRYFNAAGALANSHINIGERHEPETHLIPRILQLVSGQVTSLEVYGTEYPTKDGSCIRDYVHVMDICYAHLLVLKKLLANKIPLIYNIGTGAGASVLEVIKIARKVTNHPIPYTIRPKRAGDPSSLVANAALIKEELGWKPVSSDLESILKDAWYFEQLLQQQLETVS